MSKKRQDVLVHASSMRSWRTPSWEFFWQIDIHMDPGHTYPSLIIARQPGLPLHLFPIYLAWRRRPSSLWSHGIVLIIFFFLHKTKMRNVWPTRVKLSDCIAHWCEKILRARQFFFFKKKNELFNPKMKKTGKKFDQCQEFINHEESGSQKQPSAGSFG